MKEEKETLYQYDSSHTQSFTSVNVILILYDLSYFYYFKNGICMLRPLLL
jgi:hypothetical protein